MTTCHVTLGLANDRRIPHARCGLPAVRWGLCRLHYAMRVRLGGAK